MGHARGDLEYGGAGSGQGVHPRYRTRRGLRDVREHGHRRYQHARYPRDRAENLRRAAVGRRARPGRAVGARRRAAAAPAVAHRGGALRALRGQVRPQHRGAVGARPEHARRRLPGAADRLRRAARVAVRPHVRRTPAAAAAEVRRRRVAAVAALAALAALAAFARRLGVGVRRAPLAGAARPPAPAAPRLAPAPAPGTRIVRALRHRGSVRRAVDGRAHGPLVHRDQPQPRDERVLRGAAATTRVAPPRGRPPAGRAPLARGRGAARGSADRGAHALPPDRALARGGGAALRGRRHVRHPRLAGPRALPAQRRRRRVPRRRPLPAVPRGGRAAALRGQADRRGRADRGRRVAAARLGGAARGHQRGAREPRAPRAAGAGAARRGPQAAAQRGAALRPPLRTPARALPAVWRTRPPAHALAHRDCS